MSRTPTRVLVAVVLVALTAGLASAHVPAYAGENTSPGQAYRIDDPAKSWSVYSSLEGAQVRYYVLDLSAGDRLRVSLYTPNEAGVTPSLIVIRPAGSNGATGDGTGGEAPTDPDLPASVSVPDGYTADVVSGTPPERAEYEPFTPAAYYHTVDVDRRVETGGTYLLAVYDAEGRSGPVGMAVGFEERFALEEYLTVPLDAVTIHLWEGQHPVIVAAPYLLGFLAVGAAVRHRLPGTGRLPGTDGRTGATSRREGALRLALAVAAALFVGSAASTLAQTGVALARTGPTAGALVTLVFALVPLAVGLWLLRTTRRDEVPLDAVTRGALAGSALLGLATWGGLLVGPAIAAGVAVIPRKKGGERDE